MRKFLLLFSFCCLTFFSFPALSQKNELLLLWESRSRFVTGDIIRDIDILDNPDRAVFYARLGEVWYEKDKSEGKTFFAKAVNYATSPATKYENSAEKSAVLQRLLQIIAVKDEVLRKKLTTAVIKDFEESDGSDIEKNGEEILKIAQTLADTNPNEALNLGILTVRAKKPTFSANSIILFLKLRKKNEVLANTFYSQALNISPNKLNLQMLDNLIRITSPLLVKPAMKEAFPPVSDNALKKRLLNIVAEKISVEYQNLIAKREVNCPVTSTFARNLADKFQSLLPERISLIAQAISVCRESSPESADNRNRINEKPETIEELLEAAAKTDDKDLKTKYLLEAAELAGEQKKYGLAIRILDDISEESRQNPYGVWEFARTTYTTEWLLELIENNNLTEVYDVLRETPVTTRPFVRLSVAEQINPKQHKQMIYEFLNDSREEFGKLKFEYEENVPILINNPVVLKYVSTLYAKIGYFSEAEDTYRDSVKLLNQFIKQIESEKRQAAFKVMPVKWSNYADFPVAFFDIYFQRISENIALIDFPAARLEVRLQFLKNTLKRQAERK